LIFVWFVAIQVSGRCQIGRFVSVALCIAVIIALVVIALCDISVVVSSYIVIVIGIIDNKWSMGGVVVVCLPWP
jgi:hypothetical protein